MDNQKLSIRKVLIFDFDGTIADSLETIIEISSRLIDRYNHKKKIPKEKAIALMRNKKLQEIFKEFGISSIKIFFGLRKIRSELNKEIEYLKPIRGIQKVIREIKKRDFKLGILTSNSKNNVKKFLRKNNLDLFDFIYSEASFFNKHKVINHLLKKQKLKREEIVFIGDETRDVEAAKKEKIRIIAVSWGYNSKKLLAKEKPDFLVDKPKEITKVVANLR